MSPRRISFRNSEVQIRTDDDEDYIDTLMYDAGAGESVRGTDTRAAEMIAARHQAERVLGDLAYDSAIPVDWTPGYRLSKDARQYGHDREEAGWGIDPAALANVSSNLHRAISLGGAKVSSDAKKEIESAYIEAVRANQSTVMQAYKIRYDFRARSSELRNFPSLSVEKEAGEAARGGNLSSQAVTLPWAKSVQYEIVSRYFDRMWGLLTATRGGLGAFSPIEMMRDLKRPHLIFYEQEHGDVSDTQLHQTFDEFINFVEETARSAVRARNGAMRIVMRARNIDQDNERHAYLYRGSLSESALFGSMHRVVEDEILRCLWYNAQQLRYLFRSEPAGNPQTKGTTMGKRTFFRYTIDRVLVSRSGESTRTIEDMKRQEGAPSNQEKDLQYGVRVVIPPAPEGYLRNNVLIAFRSRRSAEEEQRVALEDSSQSSAKRRKEMEEVVHMIVVGKIPDTSTWTDSWDEENPTKTVADLPASFVMYHSRVFGATHPVKAPDADHGQIIVKQEEQRSGESVEQVGRVWWEAVYDLKWLETVSGKRTSTASPVNNINFDAIFHSLYAYPYRSTTAVGAYRKRFPSPWVQVFVEYVPTPDAGNAMRRDRAKWIRQVMRKRADPTADAQIFDPPRSFTGMKDGQSMVPWSRDVRKSLRELPIVNDFANAPDRQQPILVQTDAERARFGQPLSRMDALQMTSTTTTTTTTTTNIGNPESDVDEPESDIEYAKNNPIDDGGYADDDDDDDDGDNSRNAQVGQNLSEDNDDNDDEGEGGDLQDNGDGHEEETVPELDEVITPNQISLDMERHGI